MVGLDALAHALSTIVSYAYRADCNAESHLVIRCWRPDVVPTLRDTSEVLNRLASLGHDEGGFGAIHAGDGHETCKERVLHSDGVV
jgi:hypothetical protein